MDTEKQEVPTGSTTTYNTDAKAKNGSYSQNTTANKVENTDTYQVFTIQTPTKTYVVHQKLNFPWSKPANIALGEEVKFTIQGNKMIILDDDQKQQKATSSKPASPKPTKTSTVTNALFEETTLQNLLLSF